MDAWLESWRQIEPHVTTYCTAWLRHLAWAIAMHFVVLLPLLFLYCKVIRLASAVRCNF